MTLFQLENTNYFYDDKKILRDIDLTIEQGERVAIIGASGVGKTTLLKLLSKQQTNNIAFCAQGKHLVNNLSAYNNIYMAQLESFSLWKNLFNLIKPNQKALREITPIAESLSIRNKLLFSVNSLSAGQKQRVAIARAFFAKRNIFFGDEITSNLDLELANHVIKELLARHKTCIVALHDRQLALQYFDRIIGLKQGIIAIDTASNKLMLSDLEFLYL